MIYSSSSHVFPAVKGALRRTPYGLGNAKVEAARLCPPAKIHESLSDVRNPIISMLEKSKDQYGGTLTREPKSFERLVRPKNSG
jgi:hypothetical protein